MHGAEPYEKSQTVRLSTLPMFHSPNHVGVNNKDHWSKHVSILQTMRRWDSTKQWASDWKFSPTWHVASFRQNFLQHIHIPSISQPSHPKTKHLNLYLKCGPKIQDWFLSDLARWEGIYHPWDFHGIFMGLFMRWYNDSMAITSLGSVRSCTHMY